MIGHKSLPFFNLNFLFDISSSELYFSANTIFKLRHMINKEIFEMTYGSFDKEIIVEILDIFINEHEDRFAEMDKNLADGDFALLGANAHGLKGSIAQLFAEEEKAIAQEVESMGKQNISEGIEEKYKAMREACDRLVEEVQAYKKSYQ